MEGVAGSAEWEVNVPEGQAECQVLGNSRKDQQGRKAEAA
jgi:hypothetical protein